MPNYQPGEVLLLSFPFVNAVGTKRRPAVVLKDTGDEDIIVARITSQTGKTELYQDLRKASIPMVC